MGRIAKEKRLLIENLNKRLLGESKWNTCNQCIGTYSGSLDKCAFYAIERFEENYGTGQGTSMGDDYFEGTYMRFDKIISGRLNTHIPNAWGSMDQKTKMQIWNFMFNSDSDNNDHFRWLAILYLTARKDISNFDEPLTMKIINNQGSTEWGDAIKLVNSTNTWDYSKLLRMIDGQYRTYTGSTQNRAIYAASWSYRATALNDMYDDCISGIDPKSKSSTPKTTQSTTIVPKTNSTTTTPTPTKSDVPTKQKSKTYTYTMRQDSSYVEMGEKVKDFVNEFVDENGKFNVASLDLKQDPQNKDVEIKLTLVTDKDGYEGGTIYFDKFIDKNLTSEKAETVKLKEGTFLNKKYAFLGFKNKIAYRYDPQGNVLNRRDSSDFRNYLRTLQIQ